ncbi:hypothetical protein LSTR_LSTR015742 [Laodelphax striatellus]|uniref:Bee-milk protein n=1 Tax=Laodelphax striatellus TaxID=195883 RepID=A0A482WMY5_LAOST|nr:hypothetical protein LSTR_LSTR015742 [Laodelphax striatellus]
MSTFDCHWTIGAFLLCTFTGALLVDAQQCMPAMQDLTLMMSWKNIQWSEEQTENHTTNAYGEAYNESAIIPTRMQIWRTQVFLTFPRYRPGIPFSLGYVLLNSTNRFDTEIYPFPSWLEHSSKDSYASIVNAVDIYLDHNNLMLWVLDTGEINSLVKPSRIAPPRIFGIHITDRKVIKVIDLSDMVCAGKSRLQFVVADASGAGSDTNLFVSDAGTRSLIVYKGPMTSDSHGFRVQLPPLLCLKSTGCQQDVLHLMISGGGGGGDCSRPRARLYFSYLSGEYLFSALDKDLSEGKTLASVSQVGVKPSRLVFAGVDGDLGTNLFFRRDQDSNTIYSWNVSTAFQSDNLVIRDCPPSCRQATSVTAGYKDLIWALESNIWVRQGHY